MNQAKDTLMKFTMAAKVIIYNPERAKQLITLIATQPGAITAVHTVMQAIGTKQQVPPDIAPMLGVNIYMMLVAMAQEVTGQKPDPKIMQGVMKSLVQSLNKPSDPKASPPIQSNPPAQGGLIANAMGAR